MAQPIESRGITNVDELPRFEVVRRRCQQGEIEACVHHVNGNGFWEIGADGTAGAHHLCEGIKVPFEIGLSYPPAPSAVTSFNA